ncbi:MAG TPA: hypothetical protein VG099_31450 [Gemmataceae bacterium]|jgi:hypothetical protein|nr:hypothetical protein [Gemmataceae bacterium]
MISHHIEGLAARFWEEYGKEEPFPRDLECVILRAKPSLAIISLPRLSPAAVRSLLARRGHLVALDTAERWLNGCFYACKDLSFIFVEEGLTSEWRRAVIAHEFGHCLAHYETPRRRVTRRLGASVLPVVDGVRRATGAEELSASLAGVRIESYVHFMDRNPDGTYIEPVNQAERDADDLGLELLAPWRAVSAVVRKNGRWPGLPGDWQETLVRHFGFPRSLASYYGDCLLRSARGRLTFSQALGL